MKRKITRIEADVLIIGGGLAGCFAAIKAAEFGAEVVLFDKAHIQRSGNAGTGLHRIPLIHPDYNHGFEAFARLNAANAAGICDEDVSMEFARDTLDRVEELGRLGIPVRKEDGSFLFKPAQDICPGNVAIWGPGPAVWHDIKPVLAKKVKSLGVKVLNRTAGIGLLTRDGAAGEPVVGGIGLGTRTGRLIACSAKSVVVTTGGSYRVSRHKNSLYAPTRFIECGCPTNCGDGQYMAYRAGADIVNMEFLKLSPVWKDFAHWGCGPIGVVGHEVKGDGQILCQDLENASKFDRYVQTQTFGLNAEVLFNDASSIPGYPQDKGEMRELLWAEENEATSLAYRLWQKERGEDFKKGPVEFEWHPPYLHNNQAGIHMDTRGASTVDGLFCAGDAIGGAWRQSAGGAFVFGARAGRSAAEFALRARRSPIDAGQLERETRPALRAAAQSPDKGYSWIELEDKARMIVSEYGGPLTSTPKLERGLYHLERIKRRYLPLLYATNPREMLRASEVHSAFWVCEAHLRAAAFRRESRHSYVSVLYKRDFPEPDDRNWLKHSVIRNAGNEMTLSTKDVKRLK